MLLQVEKPWAVRQFCEKAGARLKEAVSSPVKEIRRALVHPEATDAATNWTYFVDTTDASGALREVRAFEFADVMEMGMCPGITADYVEPKGSAIERLRVHRKLGEFRLVAESGETLLLARRGDEGDNFEIFVTRDGDPPLAFGPAFSLSATKPEGAEWLLTSLSCERCEARGKRQRGVRELARFRQRCVEEGLGRSYILDVGLPRVVDGGGSEIWCSACGDASALDGMALFTSKRPRWNPEQNSLTMDFGGRVNMASAKNFQLESVHKPGKTRLLFGKVGVNEFVLDFNEPFGVAQAFAATLVAANWR